MEEIKKKKLYLSYKDMGRHRQTRNVTPAQFSLGLSSGNKNLICVQFLFTCLFYHYLTVYCTGSGLGDSK